MPASSQFDMRRVPLPAVLSPIPPRNLVDDGDAPECDGKNACGNRASLHGLHPGCPIPGRNLGRRWWRSILDCTSSMLRACERKVAAIRTILLRSAHTKLLRRYLATDRVRTL